MIDDAQPPSVERDGRLFVQGASAPLTRDSGRTIYFDALDLQLHRFFESFEARQLPEFVSQARRFLKRIRSVSPVRKTRRANSPLAAFPVTPLSPEPANTPLYRNSCAG